MKILLLFVLVFVLGGLFIISNHGIDFSHEGDDALFFTLFFSWLDRVGANVARITGDAVGLSWEP